MLALKIAAALICAGAMLMGIAHVAGMLEPYTVGILMIAGGIVTTTRYHPDFQG